MISKKPEKENIFVRNIHFTNSAREGWELILKTLEISSKILLPSYIGVTDREGSGIYDPVINTNTEHDFYELNDDLSISVSNIEKLIINGSYKLILLVHYFGFKIQNLDEIINLCKKYNLIVVEDCAHLFNYNLYNNSNVGLNSDFVFYSLHKNFPLNEGGLFIQNNLELKSPDQSQIKLYKNFSTEITRYDVNAIVDKRIENFKILGSILNEDSNIKPLKKLSKGDIPHNFPILVNNGLREKLYFWLIDNNMPVVALYYRLITPLQNEKFGLMSTISNSILNLPVHQDISERELINLVKKIKEFYEK